MILGDLAFDEVVSALSPAQKMLVREINPTVFPVPEFQTKLAAGNSFLKTIMREKKRPYLRDRA
jgi:hypothetical protein